MKKIYLTEEQLNRFIICENLNEGWFNSGNLDRLKHQLINLLVAGVISFPFIVNYIKNNQQIPEETKGIVIKTIQEEVQEIKWVLADNKTIVTVYNAKPEQCNSDYNHTASGFEINLKNPFGQKICAMERTFMAELGLQYGDVIKVEGTYQNKFDGVYRIEDTMNKRFKGKHKIDLLVNDDIKYGGTLENEYAKIYVLKDKGYTENMKYDMDPDMRQYECPD